MGQEKFSLLKLVKGTFLNKMFLSVCAWFYFSYRAVFDGQTDIIKMVILITYGAVTIIWMLSCSWSKFVEGGKLEVSAKVGTEIKADVGDIIRAQGE